MTSESSPNTAKKLTSSFSSPEITEQQQQQIPQSGSNLDALIINKSDAENETNQKAPGDEDTGGGGGDGGGESTEAVASPRRSAHSPGISSTLIKSNTVTSPTGAFTTTSITFNSTRDSGFSDSITEDISTTTTTTTSSFNTGANGACTVSPGGLVQHILNVSNQPEDVITLHTKLNTDGGRIKLKSVEEDIDIIQPTGDAAGVQQPPASGEDQNKSFVTVVKTTKVTTKVNKKTKKNKKGSKNKEENNERDSNSDDQTAPQQKQASSSSDDNKDQLGVNVIEIPIVKVDINKSTEEYVFESTPSPVKISSSIITSTTTIAHHHHHHHHHSTASSSYQHQQDLNSTVLDSEDILSSYSPAGTPHKHLPIVLTKSTEIKIEKEEKKGPVSIPVKDQKQKQDKKEKKSLKTDNKKKEKKSTSAAAAADKSPKTTKCFQLKSSSSKRKADKLDATSSAQQTTQPSKQLKIDTTQNTTGSVAGTAPTSPAAAAAEEKHVLIDDEQKDRIIYLKPEAVELIVNELHQQDQSLNDLNGKSKKALNKMVSRSLDLLRHDRAESFDKLAERLRTEHKLDEDASYQDLRNKNDSIFGKLLKEYLVDQKLLLRLPLDKTSAQPIEEVIDFASKATGPKRRIVSSGEEDNFEDATEVPETVHEVKQDQTNVETTAESQVPVDEKIQEVKEEPKEAETEQVAPVKAEAPSEDTKKDEVKVETSIDKPDGSHIVLDTIKEPPIVFECDLHPKKEVKTDSTEPQVATAVPTEASTVVVKAATETPSKDLQKGSKTAKKQGSSLLCCGAISSRKSAESDQAKKPKVKATKEKKAEKSKKTSTTTTAVKSDDKAKVETSKPAESAVATSTQPKEAVHLDFSNLDRKPDEPLATSKEPHTIDFPTILDFEVVEPKVVVKEVKKTVVETTTEVVTKEQEAAPVETEKSDKEEGPSTPPTTPTLKKNVDLLPVGDSDLEHQLDRKSLHKALEEAAAIDEAKKSDEDQEKEAEVPDQEQTVHPDAVTAEINVVEKEETTTEEQKIDTTVVNTFNVKEEAHATVVVSKEEVDDHSKQASEESKTPAKLSDDIIKLPDPNDPARLAALQVTKQATSATGSASTQAPKTDGKKKEKKTEKSDDEGSSASCFSCRGKKADKKKKSSDVVAKKSQDKKKSSAAAAATPAQAATTSDQGNKAIKVEVTDANQKQQQPGILLTGLDPPGPVISAEQQKTLLKIKEKSVSPTRTNVTSQNIITSSSTSSGGVLPGDIAQIEIRKSIHTVSTTIIKPIVSPKGDRSSVIQIVESTTTTTSDGDQKQEETVKEYIVDLAPPQVIEEIKKAEEAEPVAEPVKEDETPVVVVKEEKPLVEEETKPQDDEEEKKSHAEEVHEEPVTKVVEEEQVEKKDDVAVEVEEKVSSPVKLSDDIIKLPDPRDRIDTIPSSKQEAKPEVAVETSKPTKSSADDKKTKKEKKKEAKPAQAKKTSPIDMPLVSVLSPGDADGTTSCGALACFGKKSKKAKKQKDKAAATEAAKKPSSAAETTPKKVPETVQVKETEPSALVVDVNAAGSESTSASPRQPLEGWSKGLDRAEGEPIVRKDLVENFVAPETKQESDQVDQEKPKEEDSSKVESTEEKQPEIPSEVVEEKKDHDKEEAEKQLTVKVDGEASKLTIDSPGAIIVIDRRPDHPVVPIVVTDRPKVTDAPVAEVTSAKPDDSKAKTDKPDQKDKKTKKEKAKSNRKTNLIDMPLLSCFNPRSTTDQDDEKKPKEKKPAAKKEKKSKPVDTSAKKKPTGSDKPVPIEIEPLHISPDQPESEQQLKLVISETLNEIVTTVVQSFEQNTTTTTTEIHTKEDLPQVKPTDLNEQDIKIQLDKIEMSSSLIKQPPGLAEDRIKIDREPDIIVLPEPRTKADIIGTGQLDQPVVTITTVTTVETTTPAKKDGKEKVTKGHTSIIDMPIIDILVPKGVKKRLEKSKDPKVTETTTVTSKKTKTKTKVQVEKSKPAEKAPAQAIPTEHYVDTFFVDLIEPLPATTDVEVKKEKPKKEKKSAKVEKTETVKTVVTKKENEDLVVVITSSPSAEVIIPKPDTEEAAEKQPEAETPEQLPVVEIKSQDKEEKQPDQEVPQATKADEKSPEQVLEETRVVIKDPSDDIVKLPDPNDRAQFLAASSAAQAETAATTAASTSTSQAQASTSPGKKGKKNKKGKDHHTSPLDLPLINCMRKKDSTDSTGAEAPVVKVDKKQKAKEEREAKKRAEKEHKEQLERERKEKLEREKAEKERVERERKEQHEREKAEKERIEREKREQLELEKAEKEKADRERREREEQEKAEQRAKEEREMQLAREAEEAALKVKLEIEEARRKAEEQQVPEPVVEEKGDEKLPADEQLDESQEDQKVEYEPEDKPIKEIEGHVEHVELEPMPLVQEVQPLPAEELEAEIKKLGDEIEAIKQVEPEEPVKEIEPEEEKPVEEEHEPKAPVISEPPPNIPIVTQVIVPKTPELVEPRKTTADKSPSKDSVKRTSKIDMPLINILTPKKEKKKKSQKEAASPKKADDSIKTEVVEEVKVVIETVEDDKLPREPIVIVPPTSMPENVVVTMTTTEPTPAVAKPAQESKRDKLRREKEEKEAKRRAELEKKTRLEQEKRDLKLKKAAEAKQKKLDSEAAHKPTTTALDLPLISVVSPDISAPSTDSKKTAKQEPIEPVLEVKPVEKPVATDAEDKHKKTSPIDMPLINISGKPKQKDTKTKESSQKQKSDEPTVSCFSCKARKQKKESTQKQSPTAKQTETKTTETAKDLDKSAGGHQSPKQIKSPNEGIPLDAPYLESQHTGSEIAKIVKEIQQTEEDHLKAAAHLPEINLKPSVDVDSSLIVSQAVTVTESHVSGDEGEEKRIHPDAMEAKISLVESSVTGESTKEVGENGAEKEVHVLEKTTNKFSVKVEAHAAVLTSQKSEASYDDLNDILPQLTINSGEGETTVQSHVKLSDDTPKLTPIDKGKVAESSSVEKAQPPTKSLAKPEIAGPVAKKDDKKKKQKKEKSAHDLEDDSSKVTCFSCKGKKAASSDSSKKPGKKSADKAAKKDQPLTVVVTGGNAAGSASPAVSAGTASPRKEIDPELFKNLDQPYDESKKQASHEDQKPSISVTQKVESKTETVVTKETVDENTKDEAHHKEEHTDRVETPTHVEVTEIKNEQNLEKEKDDKVDSTQTVTKQVDVETKETVGPDSHVVEVITRTKTTEESNEEHSRITKSLEEIKTEIKTTLTSKADDPENRRGQLSDDPIVLPTRDDVKPLVPAVAVADKPVEPAVATTTHVSATTDKKGKKKDGDSSKSKLSCLICCGSKKDDKSKTKTEKKATKAPTSKPVVVEAKTQQPSVEVAIIESKPVDLKDGGELPQIVTTQEIITTTEGSSAITPPKKPPRGQLDPEVVVTVDSSNVDTSVPVDHQLNISAPVSLPEVKVEVKQKQDGQKSSVSPSTKPAKSPKQNKTSILDMPLIDILRPKHSSNGEVKRRHSSKRKSKVETSPDDHLSAESKSPEVKVKSPSKEVDVNLFRGLDSSPSSKPIVSTQQPVKPPTRLIEDQLLVTIDVKGTANELNQSDVEIFVEKTPGLPANKVGQVEVVMVRKKPPTPTPPEDEAPLVIDLPDVIDVPPTSSPRSSSNLKGTDPLPHVQLGNQKPGDSTTVKSTKTSKTIEATGIVPAVDLKAQVNGSKSDSDYVKLLTTEDKKLIKSKHKEIVAYLKQRSGYTLQQLESTSTTSTNKKELKAQEKLAEKIYERCVKVLLKKRDNKQPLTYTELSKKLEKVASPKHGGQVHIEKTVHILRSELESGSLLAHFSPRPATSHQAQTSGGKDADDSTKTKTDLTSSQDLNGNGVALRRVPSLTWRQANERARILFYKGRIPSIHYNEKRDSFRVSMITHISTQDGQDKTTEVPVNDEDVRRLLNSYGLYWDGESISLLNKSDEIFTSAEREAFAYIQLLQRQRSQQTAEEKKAEEPQTSPQPAESTPVEEPTVEQEKTDNTPQEENKSENEEDKEAVEQVVPVEESEKQQDELAEQALSEENKQE